MNLLDAQMHRHVIKNYVISAGFPIDEDIQTRKFIRVLRIMKLPVLIRSFNSSSEDRVLNINAYIKTS